MENQLLGMSPSSSVSPAAAARVDKLKWKKSLAVADAVLFPTQFRQQFIHILEILDTSHSIISLTVDPIRKRETLEMQVMTLRLTTKTLVFLCIHTNAETRAEIDCYYKEDMDFICDPQYKNMIPITLHVFKNLKMTAYLEEKGVSLIANANQSFASSRSVIVFLNPFIAYMVKLLAEIAVSHGEKDNQLRIFSSDLKGWEWLLHEVQDMMNISS